MRKTIGFTIMLLLFSCTSTENLISTNDEVKTSINDDKIWTDTPIKEIPPRLSNNDKAEIEYINKNLRYPEEAIKRGVEGRVLVKFNVETDGSLSDIRIANSPDSLLSEEALRIVKSMPKWNPGKLGDEIVKSPCILPVIFKIESYKKRIAEENFK